MVRKKNKLQFRPLHLKATQAFSFDYKSLYDSLNPILVLEALKVAMEENRKEWPDVLKNWVIELVKLSIKSLVGQFESNFYSQRNGAPTGGSFCVQLAILINIIS